MQGTQDCIARKLCKCDVPEVTGRYKVSPYIADGKLLPRPHLMKCHISSLKIIYESQCAMNLRIIRNVRPNTTTEKKNLDFTIWVQTSIFLIIFSLYYSIIPQNSWKTWRPLLYSFWSAPSNYPYAKLSKTVSYWSMFQVSADMMISAGH